MLRSLTGMSVEWFLVPGYAVAMTPLITIQIMGMVFRTKESRRHSDPVLPAGDRHRGPAADRRLMECAQREFVKGADENSNKMSESVNKISVECLTISRC